MIVLLSVSSLAPAQKIKISGRLVNRDDGNTINSGVIFLNPGNSATTTNSYGEYSFITTPGLKHITTQVMGFKPLSIRFSASADTVINLYVQVSPFELREITITADSIKNVEITSRGSFIMTPAALRETPRLFSEPDLLKSFQLLPGVVSGKDGSSDIYVRGGGAGQNIILANGCYFFLPGHLLGIMSPYDLDFLESAELYKDYFPAELGGGASSVIALDFKKTQSDSLRTQLRLGLLSSGLTLELPFKKSNWDLTAGIKRGNYSIYAPILKKIVASDVASSLPSDNYSFYDGFLRLSHSSPKWGNFSYLFFGNYDRGKTGSSTRSQSADTVINFADGFSTGWNNMVHAIQWEPAVRNRLKWKFNLNFNRVSIGRDQYMETEKLVNGSLFDHYKTSYSFAPTINSAGMKAVVGGTGDKFSWSAGLSERYRYFSPNIISSLISDSSEVKNDFGESSATFESAIFISSTLQLAEKIQLDAGVRVSGGFTGDANFIVPEPRVRLAFNTGGAISPHITFVRLSQFDHSIEGSNAGLRTMLWLPVSKEFGPEISNVYSAGFQGEITNDFVWTLDGYYKTTDGMTDYKPGASFIFDSSFVDIVDVVRGRSHGLEAGIIKRKGNLTGSVSYTYSRSRREWGSPEGFTWIPSTADRPHNFNIAAKYYFKTGTSFGLNWVYQSGAPATIYMHETSYGEFFETKNNIRYYDYHRLDLSLRQIVFKKKFTFFIDADVYNVYNHKNTFYFKKTYDETGKRYYFKNMSLFPIMPSLTVTIKY